MPIHEVDSHLEQAAGLGLCTLEILKPSWSSPPTAEFIDVSLVYQGFPVMSLMATLSERNWEYIQN